ncbi:hypothetical protein [Williamwhitmania taraxaci]|uniref:Beta-barrel porin-2, OmpL-like. bbp2 n=1 Tax=Williamwhitmania taraxaci TaxID=1640674 RepID=A0A1G6J037_9BACT|nr:hypothetical protein [Williamwhitmania taraxaci]SDC12138.1 hypothetical protein SAMN05216323_10183 [Williamwhitmania taraxaci]
MGKILSSVILLVVFTSLAGNAQEKDSLKMKMNGFIRFDYWNDTRVTDEAIEGIFSLVPSPQVMDNYGNDLNEKSSANALAVSSRVKLAISGTRVLGAAASGLLEADFTGTAGSSRVRLRHAAITLNWTRSSLLMGSYWHQMVVADAFPSIISLSTGAPIQSFNRSPQVTYTYKINSSLQATGSAAWESDYTSTGPDGASSKYLRFSSLPDFTVHLRYSISNFMIGVLGEAFWIQPRLFTTKPGIPPGLPTLKKQTNTLLGSYSYQGYMKYSNSRFFVLGKATVGQNLVHHLMIGGYGTSSIDPIIGSETYSPFTHLYSFLNVGYGSTIKPSIFIGYARNLGTSEELVGDIKNVYGRSLNIASLWRIAPNISWTIKNLMLAGEVEYTNAEYGNLVFPSKGKITDTYHVSNTRFLFIAQYNF